MKFKLLEIYIKLTYKHLSYITYILIKNLAMSKVSDTESTKDQDDTFDGVTESIVEESLVVEIEKTSESPPPSRKREYKQMLATNLQNNKFAADDIIHEKEFHNNAMRIQLQTMPADAVKRGEIIKEYLIKKRHLESCIKEYLMETSRLEVCIKTLEALSPKNQDNAEKAYSTRLIKRQR